MPESATLDAPASTTTLDSPAAGDRAPADFMGDTMSDFADMDAGKAPPARETKPAEQPTVKPADKPAAKPEDKTPEKPADKPAEKAGDEPPKPVKAAELRTAYEGLKKRVKEEFEPKIQSLESKVRDLESRKPEDAGPVLAKVQSLEKENSELKQNLVLADYTQAPEFQKVQQDYADAWGNALSTFSQLKVAMKSPDGVDEVTGEAKFKTTRRPADENDLLKLANMDLDEMYDTVYEMFGHASPEVIGQLRDIRKLAAEKFKAEGAAKQKAVEWKSQQNLQSQVRQKQSQEAWDGINKSLEEKFPAAFRPKEGDAEDAASHTKGFALANLLFVPAALTPEQVEALPASFRDTVKAGKPLTDLQKTQLHAVTRLKIANHDRLAAGRKADKARIAELEKSLAEYEKSAPPGGRAGSGGHVENEDPMSTAERELRALDK